jgi:hypothetical protein
LLHFFDLFFVRLALIRCGSVSSSGSGSGIEQSRRYVADILVSPLHYAVSIAVAVDGIVDTVASKRASSSK